MNENTINKEKIHPIEMLKGVFRKTMLFNDNIMLCYFLLDKNAEIPMHNHKEHQVGYVIKGRLKFLTENGEFVVAEGDSYIFDSNEPHGAIILEDSEVIDVFSPSRDDYK
ncbi:MAG: cupin domain-containing protein [Promethearchaeota archaeon]|jgi:quercetin dioxygenase-like cupin family protein